MIQRLECHEKQTLPKYAWKNHFRTTLSVRNKKIPHLWASLNIFIHALFHYRILNHNQLSNNYWQHMWREYFAYCVQVYKWITCSSTSMYTIDIASPGSPRLPFLCGGQVKSHVHRNSSGHSISQDTQDSGRDVSSSKTILSGNCTMFKRQIG